MESHYSAKDLRTGKRVFMWKEWASTPVVWHEIHLRVGNRNRERKSIGEHQISLGMRKECSRHIHIAPQLLETLVFAEYVSVLTDQVRQLSAIPGKNGSLFFFQRVFQDVDFCFREMQKNTCVRGK